MGRNGSRPGRSCVCALKSKLRGNSTHHPHEGLLRLVNVAFNHVGGIVRDRGQ